jgi:hypothetical protein
MELPVCPICLNATILLHQPSLVNLNGLETEAGHLHLTKVPDWETPEQWKKRTGKSWPEGAAVYFRMCTDKFGGFIVYTYKDALRLRDMAIAHAGITPKYQIVCATEAGPPPDTYQEYGEE